MRRPAGKERGGGRRGGWQLAPGEDTGDGLWREVRGLENGETADIWWACCLKPRRMGSRLHHGAHCGLGLCWTRR